MPQRVQFRPEADRQSGRLRRLDPAAYRGFACVHWSASMDRRARGWLDSCFHARFREAMLHACVRYDLACAVYCLLPDHDHFLWLGLSTKADQRLANALLRREWSQLLPSGISLQRQAYDHVMREEEKDRDAFVAISHYILENPVRADLVKDAKDWLFSGSLIPGYPSLDPRQDGFWKSFWLAHAAKIESLRKTIQTPKKAPRPPPVEER